MKWLVPMVSTMMPKGCVLRIQALPIQPGPTTVLGSNLMVSPGASVSTSPRMARRQLSWALNHTSRLVHKLPEFWMYSMLFKPPCWAKMRGA